MPQAPARPSGHELRRALVRADRGVALSLDEAAALLGARGEELDRLLAVAARLRNLGHGDVVTYSRKVFIPLTMLCRDHCHYCVFAKPPAKLEAPFLTPEEVVSIARAGAEAGCKEALFTLGDRPEDRYEIARAWLDHRGYDSTLDYVRAVAIRVIEETGLLPHLNPGVMSYEEIARLKHVSASMGIMLETASPRLSRKVARTTVPPTRSRPCACARSRTRVGSRCRSPRGSSSASVRPNASEPRRCSRSAICTGATATCKR